MAVAAIAALALLGVPALTLGLSVVPASASGIPTTTTITGTTPSPVVGQPIVVTVTVSSDSGTPAGSVTVSDGDSATCTAPLDGTTGSCPITEPAVGTYAFTASYGGGSGFDSSETASATDVTVGPDASVTTITDVDSDFVVGDPITIDVAVSGAAPGGGTPTGDVTVSDGGSQTCDATLSGGTGSCQLTESASGLYTFSATYNGDSDYTSSDSAGVEVTEGGEASTTTITSTTSSPVVGQPIEVDVDVESNPPGGSPTGSVVVSDGGSQSCTATLSGNTGSCDITETTAGSYGFTATYSGDSTYASSDTSSPVGVNVAEAATNTAITSTTANPVVGQPIAVGVSVAAVAPGSGTPTGVVQVSDGSSQTCTAELSAGTGSCDITETSAGGYDFSASYESDGNYASSTSGSAGVSVGKAATNTTITSTTANPVVGQAISVSVSVVAVAPGAGTPTGTVDVSDGNSQSCDVTLSSGSGTCEITESATATYTFSAGYETDGNYASSTSVGTPVSVGEASTSTSITSVTPSPVVGEAITIHVSVGAVGPGSGTPTGQAEVTATGGKTCMANLSGGSGSCSITETSAGGYDFSATYESDGNYRSSSSSSVPVTVAASGTATMITSITPNPVVGQAISVNVTVGAEPPGSGTPTGNVQISDGNSGSCDAALIAGSGSCEITETSAGGYDFSASYESDGNYASSSSGSVAVSVDEAATSTSITSVTANPVVGQPITVDVSVASVAPGSGTPTGTVSVSDGSSGSCDAPLSSGTGSCQIAESSAGGYDFSASYESDGNYASSSTATTPVDVGEAATTTRIVSTTGSFVTGEPITVNVAVVANAPGGGTPTGTVTVSDGASQTCEATLSGGAGSCQITESSSGSYSFTAGYASDGNYTSSASSSFGVTVGGDATTTSINSITANPVVGQAITVSVSVAVNPPESGTPTGYVTVGDDGGSHTCRATLSGGSGSCTITETIAASYPITATYSGDSSSATSETSGGSVTVGESDTTTSITSTTSNPVVGEPITVDVAVAAKSPGSGTPTTSVMVSDGSQSCTASLTAGAGGCSITETVAGPYTFTATYQSDGNYKASSTTANVTVGETATATTITSLTANPVVGEPITVSVAVAAQSPGAGTPTNSVTVSDGTQDCTATLSGGAGNCPITETTAGEYTFTASYNSDGDFATSSTATGSQLSVGKATTTTSLTVTPANPVVGQAITVDVAVDAVAPGGGTPASGTVTVSDGGSKTCEATVTAGAASCPITETTANEYAFTAAYGGNSSYSTSSTASGFNVSVSPAGTTTTITSTTQPAAVGEAVAVHVSVAAKSPGGGTPSGSVTVSDGTSGTCTGALTSGTGSCSITETVIGSYKFTATYDPGTGNYSTSTSLESDVSVGQASSRTSISLSASRVSYGSEGAKVSVSVAPEYTGTPTGDVTVKESTHVLCTADLAGGKGACVLPAASLPAGSYDLVGSYDGSTDFGASMSGTAALTVVPESTRTSLSVSASKVTYGDEHLAKASVTVAPQFAGTTASGSVTVKEGSVDLCTLALSGGRGSCTLPSAKLGAGAYHVVADYAGSDDFTASASGATTLTVEPASTHTAIGTTHASVAYGDEEAERISVSVAPQYGGTTPTGDVTVAAGRHVLCKIKLSKSRGSCSFLSAKLTAGVYHVVATYTGSADFKVSSSRTATFTVSRATTHSAIALTTSHVTYGKESGERFSVSVSSEFAGLRPPGSVVVTANGSRLCTVNLVSSHGACSLASTSLQGGGYSIKAVYEGSTDFDASSSRVVSLGVSRAGTGTSVHLSTSHVTIGDEERARISVSVSSSVGGVTPNGSVTVQANGSTVCTVGLSRGAGSCSIAAGALRPGSYGVRASYGGSADFSPSDSGSASLSVSKASTTTTLHLSASKVSQGNEQVEHFSVTVSPEFGGLAATGRVTIGTTSLLVCVITLSGGSGSCSLAPNQLGVGTYHLSATYAGTSSLDGSTSASQALTVKFVLSVG